MSWLDKHMEIAKQKYIDDQNIFGNWLRFGDLPEFDIIYQPGKLKPWEYKKPLDIDDVFKFMTDQEQSHLMSLSLCGSIQIKNGKIDMVLMGSEAIQRVEDYKTEMIKKYSKQVCEK